MRSERALDTAPATILPSALPSPRIVEIGAWGLFQQTRPDSTLLLWTCEEDQVAPSHNVREFNLKEFWRLRRRIRSGEFDLIVVYPTTRHPPWHWRPLRSLFHRPLAPWRRFARLFGIQALRLLPQRVPIVVVDNDDMRTIPRHNAFLLDRCRYYFKRELPIDRWQVFQRTVHPEMPSTRFRGKPRNRERIAKLRPWAIGFACPGRELPAMVFPEKTIDVFVSVTIEDRSTVRIDGIAELRRLAAEGDIRIFIAEQRMLYTDFMATMARAWITWSPEGFGWNCIRHHEAAAVFSVPLINQPTVVRWHPMIVGVHALYYSADVPGDLSRVIRAALKDSRRLNEMANAARQHVAQHHLIPWRHAEQLLNYALGRELPPGGVDM
jgi:hypothetical protein